MQARLLCCATLFLLTILPVAASSEKAALERPAGLGTIEVRVEGLPSSEGILFISLYLTDEGYPGEWRRAYATLQLSAQDAVDGVMLARFESVPAGWFVISVLHDADSNKEMATNALGMPIEGYGFSNNPRSFFGPPGFDNAAVYLKPGETSRLPITIK